MNTKSIQRIRTASLIAVALGLGSMAPAQQASSGQFQNVEQVTATSENFALSRLYGKPVRGVNQEQLSTLTDFLIDPKSGRVHFAVADAGGNTYRIIPMRALQPGSGPEGIVVQRHGAEWSQVGTMTADQLQANVFVHADHQARLAQQFGLTGADAAIEGLSRASTLRGRQLRSNFEQLGVVEDIVIDFHNHIAAPMVRIANGGPDMRFLVPMQRLQINANDAVIATDLNRRDFQPGQSVGTFAAMSANPAWNGQPNRPATFAVSAVQQALERDAALPKGSVHVVPESRLVLRGYVDSEQKKSEAERAAQQAAPGVRIENQITVRNW